MASLKVFVSSTCYDMHAIRAQLRSMLLLLGYEPVMSDHADVLYDPRIHTHSSCLREVENCDSVIVVIGSRFGGATIPKALEQLDLTRLTDLSRAEHFTDEKSPISITQAEVLRAIQSRLPIYAFVDSGVMRDHLTYEKNKSKPIIGEIEFSSIDKRETAAYIFEFINFLRLRNENNSVFEFTRFEDIEQQVKRQWAGLFQRLLQEQRSRAVEAQRIDNLSSQIADLKAAVLGSISSTELKDTAKGAIRYRLMIDIFAGLAAPQASIDVAQFLLSQRSWEEFLQLLDVVEIVSEARATVSPSSTIFVRSDRTFYRVRLSSAGITRMVVDWNEFQKLGADAKAAIISAVLDSRQGRLSFQVRYYDSEFSAGTESTSRDDQFAELATEATPMPRVLLTQERYIEQTIESYLQLEPQFSGLSFTVVAKDKVLRLTLVSSPGLPSGRTKTFIFEYEPMPNGGLGETLAKLKQQIALEVKAFRAGIASSAAGSDPLSPPNASLSSGAAT